MTALTFPDFSSTCKLKDKKMALCKMQLQTSPTAQSQKKVKNGANHSNRLKIPAPNGSRRKPRLDCQYVPKHQMLFQDTAPFSSHHRAVVVRREQVIRNARSKQQFLLCGRAVIPRVRSQPWLWRSYAKPCKVSWKTFFFFPLTYSM